MLNTFSHITDASVIATDGNIGSVKAAFFDDRSWAIRYLVVDAGKWLEDRKVLISPYSVRQPLDLGSAIHVVLTRQQVKDSPNIDIHQPISRQHEREYMRYYSYPDYWDGGLMWGMVAYPLLPYPPTPQDLEIAVAMRLKDTRAAEPHLRSSAAVTGYEIEATDESIGHIKDFVFDDESWAIRYLVVDTRNWWPGGRKVLIATHWIASIDWATSKVHVKLTREQVKNSPEYNEAVPIARDYEKHLHDVYDRQGYWI